MSKIICGDCNIVMSHIEDNSIDFILFSPPYDQIRTYNGYDVDTSLLGNNCFRVLKDGGICAVVTQDGTKDFAKSLTSFRLAIDWVDTYGFRLFETIIYQRNGKPGAWWNKRFRVDHDYILLFLKGPKPKSFNKEPLKIPAKHAGELWYGTQRLTSGELIPIKKTMQNDLKCRGTIWKYTVSSSEHNNIKSQHPATFPDKLANDLIVCFTKKSDIVLDPMCGSGTTCVQAKLLQRNYIGIDTSKEYCNIAKQLLIRAAEEL